MTFQGRSKVDYLRNLVMDSPAPGEAVSGSVAVPPSLYLGVLGRVLATSLDNHVCSSKHAI